MLNKSLSESESEYGWKMNRKLFGVIIAGVEETLLLIACNYGCEIIVWNSALLRVKYWQKVKLYWNGTPVGIVLWMANNKYDVQGSLCIQLYQACLLWYHRPWKKYSTQAKTRVVQWVNFMKIPFIRNCCTTRENTRDLNHDTLRTHEIETMDSTRCPRWLSPAQLIGIHIRYKIVFKTLADCTDITKY